MNPALKFLLWAAFVFALASAVRFAVGIRSYLWYDKLHAEVDELDNFNCERFHEIQNRPRPWYVRINDRLEAIGI